MLIVPELQKVVLLTPRTGTRSLKNALLAQYPSAFLLYRHMEADGVPQGYDRWQKLGVVRDPVERLWSLYKYLKRFGLDWCAKHDETYTANMRRSVERSFEDWLLFNELPFTTPYDSAGHGRFFPGYCCRHPLPENRKSQFVHLRPDLGTVIYRYADQLSVLYSLLGVDPVRQNATNDEPPPTLSPEAAAYVAQWFAWDIRASATL